MKLASLYAELLLLIQKKLCPLPNVVDLFVPIVNSVPIFARSENKTLPFTLNVLLIVVAPVTASVLPSNVKLLSPSSSVVVVSLIVTRR